MAGTNPNQTVFVVLQEGTRAPTEAEILEALEGYLGEALVVLHWNGYSFGHPARRQGPSQSSGVVLLP